MAIVPSQSFHHHQVARSKSIAVSTMRRQEGRSVARRNAECSPRLSGLRSLSIVRSLDWRGRPLGRRQSTGRRSVDARSAREWSSEAAARAICPNSLRQSFEDSNLASIVERYVVCMQCPMCLTESAAPSGSSRGCSLSMIFESRN